MPPPVRQRYNAKARQSTLGGSHKKRRKDKSGSHVEGGEEEDEEIFDSNAEILPESRSQTLKRSLTADDPGMSSKKRKRLDAYITKKLKQESRLESLSLLAQHALPSATSSTLQSTSSLGQNPLRPLTAVEKAAKREDLDVKRALDKQGKKGIGGYGEVDEDADFEMGEEDETAKFRREREEYKRDRNGVVQVVRDMGVDELDELDEKKSKVGGGLKKGRSGGKKAAWSNLTSTHPELESDFDSSDSSADEADKPTSSTSQLKPSSSASVSATSLPISEIPKPTAVHPAPSIGSGLKRDAQGNPIAPRVVTRLPKGSGVARLSMRDRRRKAYQEEKVEDEEMDEDEDEDEDDDEEGSEGDSDDEHDSEDDEDDEDDDEMDSEDVSGEEDEDEDEDEEEELLVAETPLKNAKAAKFKAWAMSQTTDSDSPDLLSLNKPRPEGYASTLPSLPLIGPLGAKYEIPSSSLLTKVAPVSTEGASEEVKPTGNTIAATMGPRPKIQRRASVDESRTQLPVVAEEQPIMEAILLHPVVIICGETGSGKTTQIPQMLYEAGFGFKGSENPGMIAITQPRRVAAVSLSVRVADELNLPKKSSVVAHQIRYSSTTSPETAIKFMTDGVLLRELAYDFLLKRYSVVVVDEAHERGVNTDVLVGVLSRVAKLREKMWREGKDDVKPLRIVIMSATLRVSDFAANKTLFAKPPPIINISARQHPVTVHFNRKTVSDYVSEAYKKVVKIHARLPPGGVLVFMTGQAEISALCRKLDKKFGAKAIADKKAKREEMNVSRSQRDKEAEEWERGEDAKLLPPKGATRDMTDGNLEIEDMDIGYGDDLAGDVDDGEEAEEDPEALDSDDEDEDAALGIDKEDSDEPIYVLPLYSLLSNEQQLKVFKPPPEGSRLVIVATNVAETSLTIPNIKYVVDAGRAKERQYDAASGVQTFSVSWISKASASQRAGRAGRTGPGHCYRLYSSNMYENHLEQFSKPEILRMPIEGIVLQMKSMNIDAVANFPFPTPPDRQGLKKAEMLLTHLSALQAPTSTTMINGIEKQNTIGGRITDLGKAMAQFPVTPRFAKMLVIGKQHGCLPYIISIVSALSVGDPFLREEALGLQKGEDETEVDQEKLDAEVPEMAHIQSGDLRAKEERKAKRRAFFKSQQQYTALGGGASDMFKILAVVGAYQFEGGLDSFCAKNFVRAKAMKEIAQLSAQITSIANTTLTMDAKLNTQGKLKPPTDTQLKVIRQILCAGFIDQVAVRRDLISKGSSGKTYDTTRGIPYKAVGVMEDVFIHPSSTSFGGTPPDYVVFGDVVRTSRVWIKTLTKINPSWLSTLGKSLCTFSRPLELPSDTIKSKVQAATSASLKKKGGSAGSNSMEKDELVRDVFVTPHFGDLGVELPVVKVVQKRVGGRWITEL